MALSITKYNTFTQVEIPAFAGKDLDWTDNTWLVEHLRMLADYIEEEKPRIINVGAAFGVNYKLPSIFLQVFERK